MRFTLVISMDERKKKSYLIFNYNNYYGVFISWYQIWKVSLAIVVLCALARWINLRSRYLFLSVCSQWSLYWPLMTSPVFNDFWPLLWLTCASWSLSYQHQILEHLQLWAHFTPSANTHSSAPQAHKCTENNDLWNTKGEV